MNFVDTYQKYWKNGYVLTDLGLAGVDREVFRSLFNPVAEVFRKYPAGDCHLYTFGPGVPILGPELVTATSGIAATLSNGQLVDALTNAYHGADVVTASTAAISTYTVTAKAGTKNWLWLFFAGYSAGSAWFNVETGAVGNIENGVTANIKPVGNGFFECSVTKKNATATTGAALYAQSVNGGVAQYVGTGQAALHISGVSVKEILGYSNTYSGLVAGNYFDSAGTTHASVDGSVGLVLDAAGSVGAEVTVGGDFASAAQWSVIAGFTVASGSLSINAGGGAITNNAGAPAVIGKTYKIDFDVPAFTSGQIKAFMGGQGGVAANAVGHYTSYVTAATTDKPQIYVTSGGTICQVDNLVVREVTGIHATQSTPGFKPTLRRGIVNLLTWSNDLTNAVWLRAGSPVVTPTSFARTVTSASYIANTTTPAKPATALPYTAATVASAGSGRYVSIRMQGSYPSRVDAVFDLQNGVVAGGYPTVSGTFTSPSASIVSLGNGKYLCAASAVSDTSLGITPFISFNSAGVQVDGTDSIETSSGSIYGLGLFAGALTAAQILAAGGIPLTTTAPASSSAGVNYLEFDGVDDRLDLGGPLFQMADDHCVVVGASVGTVTRHVVSPAGNSSAPYVEVAGILVGGGYAYARWRDNANTTVNLTGNTPVGASTVVVSARKVGNTKQLKINGSLAVAPDTTPLGTTTVPYGAIGQYAAGGDNYTGRIYPVLAIKGTVSAADLAVLEKFVAQLSGVTL